MSEYYVTVDNGVIRVDDPKGKSFKFKHTDFDLMRKFFAERRVKSVLYSSSCDYPEEDGLPGVDVHAILSNCLWNPATDKMWTRVHAIERLQTMEARPLMWAITKEGFMLQVVTVLESMGATRSFYDEFCSLVSPKSAPVAWMREDVNDEWAKMLMNRVWHYIKKNNL